MLITLLGCTALAQGPAADLLIVGDILTMAGEGGRAEAVAVRGERIVAVGSEDEVRKLAGPGTRVIEARGRTVLPGFNDAHVHFMGIGHLFSSIDLRDARSATEAAERIVRFAKYLPDGRWILGSGWDSTGWEPAELPDRRLLDERTAQNPVFIYHAKPDTAWANGAALKLAGITAKSRDPEGGEIVRRADGEPTGVLRGTAVRLVARLVPSDHMRRWADIAETASNYAASLGVTSVQDTHSDDMAAVYRELEAAGRLKTRIYDCVSLSDPKKISAELPEKGPVMVRSGCLKSFVDGDDEWLPELNSLFRKADAAGRQVAIHAIGGSANAEALEILAAGDRRRRHRIEHAEGITDEDIERLKGRGLVASIQPFLFGRGGGRGAYYISLERAGAVLAMGSDAPMTDLDPLLGIRAMTTGEDAPSIEAALRAYTAGSAFAEFQEGDKGTIEKGKLADIVILSETIVREPARSATARVVMTIVGGKVVFNDETLQITKEGR